MSDDNSKVSRRDAIRGIAAGLGTAGSLPVLQAGVLGQVQHGQHGQHGVGQAKAGVAKNEPLKFFNAPQMALIAIISELIILMDDHSPGAIAAEVPAFADLMVSESPAEVRKLWTDGLAAIDNLSRGRHNVLFNEATPAQQIAILTEVSRNEMKPQSLEERFFKAIKNITIDGYYTSKIGIHQELQYKGNTYLKEFKGCTHPEHQK